MYIYSVLQKYWSNKDKIALLAMESRHLQIWLKDEYETKLQNVTFYYWAIQHIDVLPAKKFIPLSDATATWSAEKTTVVDDRQIKKAVKMNPKGCVCKNHQHLHLCILPTLL